jgi:hypothetical protein
VHLLDRTGAGPGVDIAAVSEVTKDAAAFFGRPLPGVIHRTGPIPYPAA